MSYILIRRKYLYFYSFKNRGFSIVFQHEEERKSKAKMLGALFNKLFLHLWWKHLHQFQSLFYFKSTVYFRRVDDVLPNGVVKCLTHMGWVCQPPQNCQSIPDLGWWFCEVFDDITDLCDIVGEDQTTNQYNESQYYPFVDIIDNDISESNCSYYACRPIGTVKVLDPPNLVWYAVSIHPVSFRFDQCNNQQ